MQHVSRQIYLPKDLKSLVSQVTIPQADRLQQLKVDWVQAAPLQHERS